MKILQVIHSLSPGGAERLVVDLTNKLAASTANDVVLVTLKNRTEHNEDFYSHEISNTVKHIKLSFGDGFNIRYIVTLHKLVRAIKPDIVHVHCVAHYLLFTMLRYRKPKYVFTLHSKAEQGLPPKMRWLFLKQVKLNRVQVATISPSNRESFRMFTGLNNDKMIYNGRAATKKSDQYESVKNFIENIRETSVDSIILLNVARCSEVKNLGLLINSVNKLNEQGKAVSLLIVGDGYNHSVLGNTLKQMAGEGVHFVGPQKNVSDYYMLCDAFCLSSLYEGMPISLIEALSCGCPVISTPVSGVVDIITNGVTGFVSPDFSEENYIHAIQSFIDRKKFIQTKEIIKLYERNFSIDECANKYYMLYSGSLS